MKLGRANGVGLPRFARVAAIIVGVLIVLPYAIVPFYRFITPVSMPMLWRHVTGARVERIVVPLSRISQALRLTVIGAEDGGFCHNPGIDLAQIRQALRQSNDNIDEARGASTITQQTAKNLFLWEGHSVVRKLLEIPLALWMTLVLPKRRILEIYLNVAEWGPNGEFGAEAGARFAFGTSAGALSLFQAAELAAILPNPVQRSARNPNALVRRLAGVYVIRALDFGGLDSCVRGP